jgi:hypothetical protein
MSILKINSNLEFKYEFWEQISFLNLNKNIHTYAYLNIHIINIILIHTYIYIYTPLCHLKIPLGWTNLVTIATNGTYQPINGWK